MTVCHYLSEDLQAAELGTMSRLYCYGLEIKGKVSSVFSSLLFILSLDGAVTVDGMKIAACNSLD